MQVTSASDVALVHRNYAQEVKLKPVKLFSFLNVGLVYTVLEVYIYIYISITDISM